MYNGVLQVAIWCRVWAICRQAKDSTWQTRQPIVNSDPFHMPKEYWIDDITHWPTVEFGQIYIYLIDIQDSLQGKKMKAYKSLEVFNYYRYACPYY